MMNIRFTFCLVVLWLPVQLQAQLPKMVDPGATRETIALYHNLKKYAEQGIMFGHQDANAYGLNEDGSRWKNEDNRSDVKTLTGSHPAVFGWDLGKIELASIDNLDGVFFNRMKFWIENAYDRGGVNTISWHAYNPEGGNSWTDGSSAIPKILPGGELHENYKSWLNIIGAFANDLVGSDGNPVPVIFRPYHELTGGWFWWGSSSCSPEQFKALWRFTVEYLRDEADVHNFIYCYSTDIVNSETAYLERYPGDDYVDVLGIDDYWHVGPLTNPQALIDQVKIPIDLAFEKNKVAALTETGYEAIPQQDWWTKLFSALEEDPTARKISWLLVWRNYSTSHHYAPYPGQVSAPNFIDMYNDPFSWFEDDLPDMYEFPDVILSSGTEHVPETFSMVPNPVHRGQSVHFRIPPNEMMRVEIFSIRGQRIGAVRQLKNANTAIYVIDEQISPGIYVVRYCSNKGTGAQRLLVR